MSKKLKVIIAGSRSLYDPRLIPKSLAFANISRDNIKEVVCGGARGVDTLGKEWAELHGIKVKEFLADWKNIKAKGALVKSNQYGQYNAKAGFARNEKMAEYADVLVAIWKDGSSGTEHMIECMQKMGKPYHVYEVDVKPTEVQDTNGDLPTF